MLHMQTNLLTIWLQSSCTDYLLTLYGMNIIPAMKSEIIKFVGIKFYYFVDF